MNTKCVSHFWKNYSKLQRNNPNFYPFFSSFFRLTSPRNASLLSYQQNQTDLILQSPLLWDKTYFSADRPTAQGGQYGYLDLEQLQNIITDHRQTSASQLNPPDSTTLQSTVGDNVLNQWQWYRALTNDIYGQITELFLANTDLSIWPNFLNVDYAVMFHRMLNHKRILGSLLLYYGKDTDLFPGRGIRDLWIFRLGFL